MTLLHNPSSALLILFCAAWHLPRSIGLALNAALTLPLYCFPPFAQDISIGKNTNIQDNAIVHVSSGTGLYPPRSVSVGSSVTVGHGAVLHACTVEDETLIGMGAVVMDGAVVEKNALVAAGAVVPPGTRCETFLVVEKWF